MKYTVWQIVEMTVWATALFVIATYAIFCTVVPL